MIPCYDEDTKGVPNVHVFLDWDEDNDPTTGYTPYGGDQRHGNYDITQMNGSYYFYFYFNSNQPASYYSDKIRVYANRSNGESFNGDTGIGGSFPSYCYIDISDASWNISESNADVTVNSYDGGAQRYFYRAENFCKNEMVYNNTGSVCYFIRTDAEVSFFCRGGNCGEGNLHSLPYILFNTIPSATLTYHEHGHYINYKKNNINLSNDCEGPHSFSMETTRHTAWNEGWAEFYASAANEYWYANEMPDEIELSEPLDRRYQFLDHTQQFLPTNSDRLIVEGAVASFMHSLWDGVETRAPGYSGDNDDLKFSGEYILEIMDLAEMNCALYWDCPEIVLYFKNYMKTFCNSRYHDSINAMFNYFFNENGLPSSATPTTLNVLQYGKERILSWNDNTCSDEIVYIQGYCDPTFSLERNNELGFRIYRKPGTNWDGTLNGYTLVHETGQDVTTWRDDQILSGHYIYAVVAVNSYGESVPKAYNTFVPPSVSLEDDYLLMCPSGDRDTLRIHIDFFDSVMTESIGTNDIWLQNPAGDSISFYIEEDKIYADSAATAENGWQTTITREFVSGHYNDSLLVCYSNEVIGELPVTIKSPDYIVDGEINSSDYGKFGLTWQKCEGDSAYNRWFDYIMNDTPSCVGMSDWGVFGLHWGHSYSDSMEAMLASGSVVDVDLEVIEGPDADGFLRLKVSLGSEQTYRVLAFMLEIEEYRLVSWDAETEIGPAAEIEINGKRNVFIGSFDYGSETNYEVGILTLKESSLKKARSESTSQESTGMGITLLGGELMRPDGKILWISGEGFNDVQEPVVYRDRLYDNYPNPFNPITTIRYSVSRDCRVNLKIFNVKGQLIKTLADGFREKGRYEVKWKGTNNRGEGLASGVYFYRLKTDQFTATKKMVLLR